MVTYLLFAIINSVVHLAASFKNPASYRYPQNDNQLIRALIVYGYTQLILIFIVFPNWASGYAFLLVLFLLAICVTIALRCAHSLYKRWQSTNIMFQSGKQRTTVGDGSISKVLQLKIFSKWSPLLLKNFIKIQKERNALHFILVGIFIIIAYLISVNNEAESDRLAVLFAITCIYAYYYSSRALNLFSQEEESTLLIYSLPFHSSNFYFSIFSPLILWMYIILTFLALLMLLSSSAFISVVSFWLKSILAATIFLVASCNYGLASYPDIRKTRQQFFRWTLTLIIFSAVFYKYHILIICFMILLSFVPLRKIKLYRIE